MIKLSTTKTRPSTAVPWNKLLTPAVLSHMNNNYFITNKVLSYIAIINGVTSTGISIYANQAAYDEFYSDPIIVDYINKVNTYNSSVNIQTSNRIVTTIDDTDSDYIQYNGVYGAKNSSGQDITDQFSPPVDD